MGATMGAKIGAAGGAIFGPVGIGIGAVLGTTIGVGLSYFLNKIQLIYLPSLIYDLSIQTSKTLNLYEFINYIQVHNLFL
jgi:uncharacterized membrane protein